MSIWVQPVFATLWQSEDRGNFVKASISTSEKDREDETKYINSNWNVSFLGKSVDKIRGLPERTRFKILSAKISTSTKEYNGEKKTFTNLAIFDIEFPDNNAPPTQNSKPTSAPKNKPKSTENQAGFSPVDDQSDELPF